MVWNEPNNLSHWNFDIDRGWTRYSLYDLPRAWPATTRHREAEGSSYYRHFYMGLLREDGSPKRALDLFPRFTPVLGICQWFHFRGPPARRCGGVVETAGRQVREDGSELGRQLSSECGCLVRSADGGARRLRRDAHVLLHARVAERRRRAAPHQSSAQSTGVRGALRNDGAPVRRGPGDAAELNG
jgi:hypothetical protein